MIDLVIYIYIFTRDPMTAISRKCCSECACGSIHTRGCCRLSENREIFKIQFPSVSRLANCILAISPCVVYVTAIPCKINISKF